VTTMATPDDPSYSLRAARADELTALARLEDLAGELYAEAGLPPDLPGLEIEVFEEALTDDLLWVLADADDRPVAFALCWRRPDALHLRELDVHPAHARRRLGRRLIDHVRQRAAAEGRSKVTLTTFADPPWNAPLYRRYGFVEIPEAELPRWLAEIRRHERARGLDRWPRIAMARPSQ
jgi:ribosomal protein S18 acetylase RimI-like enzyme